MAKRKVAVRRKRIPNGHVRIEMVVPMETENRIARHCQDNNISPTAFYKKAIYNVLPVKYEVDKQFVFPFGKYTGETAGSVQEFDPDYLNWAARSITGFELASDIQANPIEKKEDEFFNTPTSTLYTLLRGPEVLRLSRYAAWAYNVSTGRYRKLAKRFRSDVEMWRVY